MPERLLKLTVAVSGHGQCGGGNAAYGGRIEIELSSDARHHIALPAAQGLLPKRALLTGRKLVSRSSTTSR